MRLDLYLKASRLCLRRSVAQTLCDAKLVSVNQHVAKPSHTVKVGDEITIRKRNLETTVRVLAVPEVKQTSRKEAGSLYELINETRVDSDD
jgi:ribosomal 50S subunit-recycling heat shock protein